MRSGKLERGRQGESASPVVTRPLVHGTDREDETDAVHKDEFFYELYEECREMCQPTFIGTHICDQVLESFKCSGVYVEVDAVPYFSVRDFLTSGLAACDPDGGSSSGKTWWSGLSEFFENYYDGTWDYDAAWDSD